MKFHCFDDNIEQSRALVAQLTADLVRYLDGDSISKKQDGKKSKETQSGAASRVSLCLPGGTTPGPVFDELSKVPLDWGRVGY